MSCVIWGLEKINYVFYIVMPPLPEGGGGIVFYLCPSVRPSFRPSKIFFVAFFSVTIVGSVFGPVRFLLPACRLGFFTHWTYMHIFRHIFLSNYWWQRSDIWSQALYRYSISWEAFFFYPSDSYFLFAKERGYHRWANAHSSSCLYC
jgi:hypothetical protein